MTGWLAKTTTAATVACLATLGSAGHAQSKSDFDRVVQVFNEFGGRLGVAVRDLNEDELKGKSPTGVVIDEVESDSAAQKAGFKTGDVVVELDGERVRSTRQFTRLVQESPDGRAVSAVVMRDGQRVTLSVQPRSNDGFRYFDQFADFPKAAFKMAPPVWKGDRMPPMPIPPPALEGLLGGFAYGRLGIGVQDLSSQLADYFGTKDGVLVTSVTDNSNASKAGVKAGDVITSLNGQNVTSAGDLRTRTQRLDAGDEFTIAVVRDKKSVTLKGTIEQPEPRRSRTRAIL